MKDLSKDLVFVFFVFGRYARYVPYCIYGILKSYPDAFVKVFISGDISDAHRKALDIIPSSRYEIKERYFNGININGSRMIKGSPMALRWLIPFDELKDFKYAYIGDVDMLIAKEKPSLANAHVNHMRRLGVPFSNALRGDKKRLTGLHFIDVKSYYDAVGGAIDTYLTDAKKLNMAIAKCLRNEHFLYNLVAPHIDFKEKEDEMVMGGDLYYRPHHGTHLGLVRGKKMTPSTYDELQIIPDYLFDKEIDDMLKLVRCGEIINLRWHIKKLNVTSD
jgi:hypothetical protein